MCGAHGTCGRSRGLSDDAEQGLMQNMVGPPPYSHCVHGCSRCVGACPEQQHQVTISFNDGSLKLRGAGTNVVALASRVWIDSSAVQANAKVPSLPHVFAVVRLRSQTRASCLIT